MKKIVEYTNGNTKVVIYDNGTKVRTYKNEPRILFPESIDVKITNSCNLGCKYCHENSTVDGKEGDLEVLKGKLRELPAGVELAIGGGNPLEHSSLFEFLIWCKTKGFIVNLTVNQAHLPRYYRELKKMINLKLVYGIGISIVNTKFRFIKKLKKLTSNIVYHVIAGVNDISMLDKLIELKEAKVLILGYKYFGRGKAFKTDAVRDNIFNWKWRLHSYFGKLEAVSFDNLAIEQLDAKRFFTKKGWAKFYMGDEFTFSMYIDAVEKKFAPTSRDADRVSFNEMHLIQFFNTFKKIQL